MKICGQHFSPEIIKRIQNTVDQNPAISRRGLSLQVCEWMDWRSPNGKFQDMSCRKALLELQRKEFILLPEIKQQYHFQQRSAKDNRKVEGIAEIDLNLTELRSIEIIPISSRYSKLSPIWNDLMDNYHYLGGGSLCGAQIRYLVSSEYGWIGALSFNSGCFSLKERDQWIGWSDAARYANLRYVLCNSRFLILPTVHVPNLASHVLSQCTKRLSDDWNERYGYKPILLETFVDSQKFRGSSYQAANWINVGQTSGRRAENNGGKKEIYVFPLQSDFKKILCTEPIVGFGMYPRSIDPKDWAEEEFGIAEFYDDRLRDRLCIIARDFFSQPGVLIPQACNGLEAKAKGAYRFFDNRRVSMEAILRSHTESTVGRIKEHKIVLAVQDTTTLNYTAYPSTEGLGPISKKKDKAVGLILHGTMAFTVEGTPLGLVDVQCWARDEEEAGKSEHRKKLPIEEKESIKWLNSYRTVSEVQGICPETMIVSVGDREADIYELFHETRQNSKSPQLLVRAERSRNRKVGDTYLWDKMLEEPVAGNKEIFIPKKGNRPERIAKLAIRFSAITLKPPQMKKLEPVELYAVYAREINYSADVKEPLEWMLLTTVKVAKFEDAIERLDWYVRRWGIEIYHRTLKSGCRIEDRRFDNAESIESCLAVDMVVAWRIFYLTMQGRETPSIPCNVFLKEEEWKVLYARINNTNEIPEKPPTLQEAIRMIASLGGFLGRKSDKKPGTTTIWRGLQRLDDMVSIYKIFNGVQKSGP